MPRQGRRRDPLRRQTGLLHEPQKYQLFGRQTYSGDGSAQQKAPACRKTHTFRYAKKGHLKRAYASAFLVPWQPPEAI